MERAVHDALTASADDAGAMLWRRICRDLHAPLRIAVVARDWGAAQRWLDGHGSRLGAEFVPVRLDESELDLGNQDRLLGCHALLFLTPMTAPLGTGERLALEELVAAGCPADRRVAVVDDHLLALLSDHPDQERQAVYERVEALLPEDWPTLRQTDAWITSLSADLPAVVARRCRDVARYVLNERHEALDRLELELNATVARLQGELGQEERALAEARRQAQRFAAHTLAIVKRQTERLELDLAAFIRTLEADLPTQVHGLEDVAVARRTLPHWISHVLEGWMTERLAVWRRDVLGELEELELDDRLHAELLVPALHPGPVPGESRWTQRMGTTAAFGGAAALMMLGLWIPGLVALAGGFAVRSIFKGPGDAEQAAQLILVSRTAVRELGDDARLLLHDQLERLNTDLDRLRAEGDQSDTAHAAAAQNELGTALFATRVAIEALAERRTHLDTALHALAGESAP